MELCITNELRNKVAAAIPDINAAVIQQSVTLEFKQEEAFKYNEQYVRSQTNKICAFDYFNNLVEVFSEIRYSAISAECCRELLKSAQATEDNKKELSWQFKYYAESAIYRYYSFWEYVGRFFNEYYDLKLDVDKKDLNKEREFYSAQVLNIIIKKYYHKLLSNIFELWAKSEAVFDYRIIKTHKHNPRIGDRTFKLTKQRTEKGKKITIDAVKEYSGSDLQKLLMITHKHSRLAVEYIGELFAIGHTEVQKIILEPDKPLLVTPDIKTILQFQKISKPRNNKRN